MTHQAHSQYVRISGVSYTYDGRGNLTSDGSRSFQYDFENHLLTVSGSGSLALTYDPLGRLWSITGSSSTTRFLYDGDRLVAEYNGSTLLRRYAYGTGIDEPVVWYEDSGLTQRSWLHGDQQGSVIATSNGAGVGTVYAYGAFGEIGDSNWGGSRFRYTGQIVLPEAKLYHYKARIYDPGIGRFLQTDPVGYSDDFNLYAYVGNDPLNRADPTGQFAAGIAVPVVIVGALIVAGCEATGSCEQLGRLAGDVLNALRDIPLPSHTLGSLLITLPIADPLPNSVNSERAPTANDGYGAKHGNDDHNAAIDAKAGEMRDQGYTDIRKNQAQVDAAGNKLDVNRPDLQGTSPAGQREAHEWDRT